MTSLGVCAGRTHSIEASEYLLTKEGLLLLYISTKAIPIFMYIFFFRET